MTADRPFAAPEKAARRLLEHAHAFEPIHGARPISKPRPLLIAPSGVLCDHLPNLGLCYADFSENFFAIFAQPPGSLPFGPKLSDQCRSICAARGSNFLKQHKGVRGYPFEIALHFRPPGWFLFLSLIGTFEGGT
jgi:hypothetical protein